jgi:DNA polymerase-1
VAARFAGGATFRDNRGMSEKTMLLVDGSSYLYRAYHALPNLSGPGGVPTGALHGFVAMMKRLREQFPAEHAACVFDAKGPTFRDDWYAEYKANRSPMPEPLVQQIAPIHEAVRLLGWPVLEVPGIEADDAIGTLARAAAASGHRVVISTGDKDLAQLVDANVTLINTMSNERLDAAGVQDKFGVPPERIIDYLTLVGDSVDNVPGVDKVGPKTAVKWLAEYGSLAGVMAAADGMKGAVGENLRKALPWLPQAQRLVTVVTDCDLAGQVPGWPALEGLHFNPIDRDGLLEFFDRYGLKTFRRELTAAGAEETTGGATPEASPGSVLRQEAPTGGRPAGDAPTAAAASELRYETVLTLDALDAWIERIDAAPLTALDTETDSLDAMRAQLVGISLSVAPGEAAYIPLRHAYAGAPEQLDVDAVLARLKPWLEDPGKSKLGQNVKYDTHVFANAGIEVQGYVHDTMLESYVLEAHRPHSLESLAQRHLDRSGLSYEDLCGKGVHQISFAQVDIERAARYSGEDSEMCLDVHRALWPQIEAEPGLRFVYEQIEMPTSRVLARIERNGVLIDVQLLATQSRELAERMVALEAEAHALAGQPFNLGSPKQIGEILFGKLGLPVGRKTASGAPSTDEEVLEKLAADFPLPAKLLEHRSLSKLKGTYTDKLPLMVNPDTGRVHTN